MNIAIFASHNGSNLQSIIDALENGSLRASISVVISNNSNSGALLRAEKHHIPHYHLSSRDFPDFNDLDRAICEKLDEHGTDIILLAGYMKKIGPLVLNRYQDRILNTHPALLPKFGGKGMFGMNVHRAVIQSGEKMSGVTVHLVNSEYDEGRILAQAKVPVEEGDTPESLCERVMARERAFIVEVLSEIVSKGSVLGK